MLALLLLALQSGGLWKIQMVLIFLIGIWYVYYSQARLILFSFSFKKRLVYVGAATVGASAWWYISYESGPQLTFEQLVETIEIN